MIRNTADRLAGLWALGVFLCLGCGGRQALVSDSPLVSGAFYRNDFFGFTMEIPELAEVMEAHEVGALMREGTLAVLGEGNEEAAEESLSKTTMLLALKMGPSQPLIGDSAIITIAAEKLSPEIGIKNGPDYLRITRGLIIGGSLKASLKRPVYGASIGGVRFDAEEYEIQQPAVGPVGSALFVVLRQGHAFLISLSAANDEGMRRARAALASVKFKGWYSKRSGACFQTRETGWIDSSAAGGIDHGG